MKMRCERCPYEIDLTPVGNLDIYRYEFPDGHTEILCNDCADSHGFCLACNGLAAGADDDWLGRFGVCYGCWQEMEEYGEDDSGFEY